MTKIKKNRQEWSTWIAYEIHERFYNTAQFISDLTYNQLKRESYMVESIHKNKTARTISEKEQAQKEWSFTRLNEKIKGLIKRIKPLWIWEQKVWAALKLQ